MRTLLLLLLLTLPARAAPDLTGIGFDPHPGARLPTATPQRDETGRAITLADAMQARPTILALVYFHCPNLCGVVEDDLYAAIAASGLHDGEYSLVAASIDPSETQSDAAAAKAAALARYPQARDWRFLVGDTTAIQRAVGFHARYDDQIRQFIHPAGLTIASTGGTVTGYLLGVGTSPVELRAAVAGAALEKVSAAPSPLLLLCFHFDPATGRYTLAIERILRIAAAVTVVGIGATLVHARRHRRA